MSIKYNCILFLGMLAFVEASAQSPLKGRDESVKGPQTFAIVVGISHYRYIRPLSFADKDAELFRDWLRSPAGGKMKDDNIFCLLNEEANNSNFWGKGFQWLKKKDLQRGDKLFIYLAGHGDAIDEDQYFFLGYDCKPDGDKNNYLVSGAIQLFNLKKKIAKETTRGVDVIFIMDACRSNELPGGSDGQNFLNTAISQKQTGEIMMLSTTAGQESLEDASIGNGHGLFTWYLVDGLTGEAESSGKRDGKISFAEISAYVDNNVVALALLRFKRKQEPFFCCNENNEKILTTIDTAYLQQWLKIKKQQEKRSGRNSFESNDQMYVENLKADTVLIETYNRFNRAIKNNRLSGDGSAEDFFQQLNKKYPGNPYTLDAKSTLAVEYLNVAQQRVNRYLDCVTDISVNDKQANYAAALNLEKAILSFREDDADFANSLYGRLYLLKASGDFGSNEKNGSISDAFRYAYSGLAFDPKGSYIMNKLAQLHFQNNNRDSALYYAKKAVEMAPNWNCALTTLALIQNSTSDLTKRDSLNKPKSKGNRHLGLVTGIGINYSFPSLTDNPNNPVIDANTKAGSTFDLGVLYYLHIGGKFAFRPSASLNFVTTSVEIQRRNQTSGTIITETIKMKQTAINLTLPVLFNFSTKRVSPYLTAGPLVSFGLSQDNSSELKIPLKKSELSVELGFGFDISVRNSTLVLSPELKYYYGFTDLLIYANTVYTNGLSSIERFGYKFTLYLRKK